MLRHIPGASARYALKREVAVCVTGNFRRVCPILNRATRNTAHPRVAVSVMSCFGRGLVVKALLRFMCGCVRPEIPMRFFLYIILPAAAKVKNRRRIPLAQFVQGKMQAIIVSWRILYPYCKMEKSHPLQKSAAASKCPTVCPTKKGWLNHEIACPAPRARSPTFAHDGN